MHVVKLRLVRIIMCVDAKHRAPMGMWHQIVPVFFALTHRSRPGLECHATKTAIPIFL